MISLVLQRLVQSLFSLLLITVLVFVFMFVAGDPVNLLLPRTATQIDRDNLRKELGLDQSLPKQYGSFVWRIAHGDFGRSYHHGRPVMELIGERIPATFELAVVSLVLSVLIGIPLGIAAGAWPRAWLARFAMGSSMFGISLPTFWLGLLMIMFFAVELEWLPPMGRGETRILFGQRWSVFTTDGWMHMIMPAVTLSLHHIAMLIRLVRSELFETLRQPFIRTARSYGFSEASVIGRHALRNSLIPILTVTAVEFGQLIAFSVVTESIFQWPGLGKLLIDSVYVDRPIVVAYLMLTGVIFLSINFLVDITYAFADPRIRTPAEASQT